LGQLHGFGDGGKRLEGDEDAEADGDIFVDHWQFLLKRVLRLLFRKRSRSALSMLNWR
jgi:hypothetical protein